MRYDRRRFLAAGAALATGAALGPMVFSRREARAWGLRPDGIFPAGEPYYKVLEIYLYGGLSPWETFHVRSDGDYADWFDFQSQFASLSWCAGGPTGATTEPNGQDIAGNDVFLGPCTKPLWPLKNRIRILPVRHNLLPHEAAIPYALTGLRTGSPRLAGMGAHIQQLARTEFATATPRPRSYVVFPPTSEVFDESRLVAMQATGMHPGGARPLFLRLGDGAAFRAALARGGIAEPHDRMVDVYRDQYRRDLRWGGPTIPDGGPEHERVLRTQAFAAYNAAIEGVLHTEDIEPFFSSDSLLTPSTTAGCGRLGTAAFSGTDYTRKGIELAAHLFANDARYVGLVDVGLRRAGTGGGYDTHPEAEHAVLTSFNLNATLSAIRDAVTAPPGGTPAINLDDTLIVLNTEFGRTPYVGLEGGRDHHPEGYVMTLIGGPIGRPGAGGTARANSGVAGGMDASGRTLDSYGGVPVGLTATDVIGAVLLAAGVNPREHEVFGVGDFSLAVAAPADLPETTMRKLASRVLGIPGVMP